MPDGTAEPPPTTQPEGTSTEDRDAELDSLLSSSNDGSISNGGGGESSDSDEESHSNAEQNSVFSPKHNQQTDKVDVAAGRAAVSSSSEFSFTRKEALRTPAIYILAIDKMVATTVGVSCGQLLLLTMRENGVVGVDIALHVMIPCGLMQAFLPLLTGWLRDRGLVEPRVLVGLASWQIALAAVLLTQIQGAFSAVLYGMNFGSVWGVKMTTTAMTYVSDPFLLPDAVEQLRHPDDNGPVAG